VKEHVFPVKRDARRGFERAAATYDAAAVLQREVGRRLFEHLDPIVIEPRRIVDLGCGTGESLAPLGKRFPKADLVGIDFSLAMLERVRARTSWLRRTFGSGTARLVCADAARLPFAHASVDLVFSNLALQWNAPEPVFAEAARVLPSGGLLMFSTLGPDTLKELRAAFEKSYLTRLSVPHVHDFVDMHDLGDALVHAGFADPVMEMEVITLEYSGVDDLARDLKATGAHNTLPHRARGLTTPRLWKRMADSYEPHRREGALPATFEIVYGHAWKTAPRHIGDGRQVIDFRERGAR
jgi:malonyl-CoA O-methyltransferase